eukprot:scaffold14011_cov122-Isochrysis_galbana.AAC.3
MGRLEARLSRSKPECACSQARRLALLRESKDSVPPQNSYRVQRATGDLPPSSLCFAGMRARKCGAHLPLSVFH